MELKPASNISPTYSQTNALDSMINSVGTALWYERDAGQKKDAINMIDSTAVTMAYGVYDAQKTAFDALAVTYNADKKTYEDAWEALKKDAKTTLPKRPNMPSPPGAYSGP